MKRNAAPGSYNSIYRRQAHSHSSSNFLTQPGPQLTTIISGTAGSKEDDHENGDHLIEKLETLKIDGDHMNIDNLKMFCIDEQTETAENLKRLSKKKATNGAAFLDHVISDMREIFVPKM